MPKITALTPQRNKNRLNLFLDGKFFCGLMAESAVIFKLKEGEQVDIDTIKDAIFESERRRALDKALVYVSKKLRTESEMRKYLASKGFCDEVIELAIDRLKELDYINDHSYAERFVEQKKDSAGVFLLKQKMYLRGVQKDAMESALADIDGQQEAAQRLCEKYMRSKDKTAENKQKLMRYLAGKGFERAICRKAAEQTFGGFDDEACDDDEY